MNSRIAVNLTMTVRSPFLFPGLANSTFGVDVAPLRDERLRPVLPASQLQGLLRERLGELAATGLVRTSDIDRLFGKASAEGVVEGEFNRPVRGCVIFGDLAAEEPFEHASEMTRIEIDDLTGAAKTGHLQVIELVAPPGKAVAFQGRAVLFWPEADAQRIVGAWELAMRLVPAIGAFKTAGFGEVLGERCSAEIATHAERLTGVPLKTAETRIGLAVTFDRPILVDARRVADNAFVGAVAIPGGVFKGALARKIALLGKSDEPFAASLDNMVVSHARPENAAGEPGGESLPLSLVSAKIDGVSHFGDALQINRNLAEDGMIGAMIGQTPALFQADWKETAFRDARSHFQIADFEEPDEIPRTHTAIGPDGVAADQLLFTTIARSVELPGPARRQRRYLMTIDYSNVPPAHATELHALMTQGLDGIGRTGASATFARWEGVTPPAVKPVLNGTDDLFAVVLRTDAVLTDPRTPLSAAEAYRSYWQDKLRGATLVDFCASQHLAGGYLATRYRPWGRDTYHPFVVTDAGSVFLLKGDLAKQLENYARTGLPLPVFEGAAPLDWTNCPFVPGNGYGAIRADHLSCETWSAASQAVTHG